MVLTSSVHFAAWGNYTFHDQEILQISIFDKSLLSVSHVHPAFCWVPSLYWHKCKSQEIEHNQKKMNRATDTWVAAYDWLFFGENHYPVYIFFPTTPNLSTATTDIRSASTRSSVTFSRGKVKLCSSLSSSPTSSGQWHFSVAYCIGVKSRLVLSGLWNYQLELKGYHHESSMNSML